jgi:hypothetical protein
MVRQEGHLKELLPLGGAVGAGQTIYYGSQHPIPDKREEGQGWGQYLPKGLKKNRLYNTVRTVNTPPLPLPSGGEGVPTGIIIPAPTGAITPAQSIDLRLSN